MNRLWIIGVAVGAAIGSDARGQQNRFDFVVSNVISPEQPSATVEVWAVWDANYYAFASGAFDVIGDGYHGGFSDPHRMLKGPGTKDGEVSPDGQSVLGIVAGQYMDWQNYANTADPILLWQAMWSTSDFKPRSIDLRTVTGRCDLYLDEDKDGDGRPDGSWASILDDFTEGSAAIQVVPAPSASLLPLLGIGSATRRRRPRRQEYRV